MAEGLKLFELLPTVVLGEDYSPPYLKAELTVEPLLDWRALGFVKKS
jgi:hypothetical protein